MNHPFNNKTYKISLSLYYHVEITCLTTGSFTWVNLQGYLIVIFFQANCSFIGISLLMNINDVSYSK